MYLYAIVIHIILYVNKSVLYFYPGSQSYMHQ